MTPRISRTLTASLVMFGPLLVGLPALADDLAPTVPSLSQSQVQRLDQGEVLVEVTPGEVPIGDAIGVIDAPPERIADVLRDFDHYPDWMSDMAEGETLGQDGDTLICRGVTDTPWPMSNREWTVRAQSSHELVDGIDAIVSSWRYVPGSGNIVDSSGYWLLIPWGDDGQKTLVHYRMSVDLGTWIPDFLVDWSTANFLPAKITDLRHRLGV